MCMTAGNDRELGKRRQTNFGLMLDVFDVEKQIVVTTLLL